MLKKTITYTDYNGVTRTEDFYFNLTKTEAIEMELSEKGGITAKLTGIVNSDNNKEIVNTFKEIILKAYGEKSEDGKRFIKTSELREAFSQTEAFVELFMEIAENTDAAVTFINGILPSVPNK